MSVVYKRSGDDPNSAWNELIRRVNELANECSLEHINEVGPRHRWSKSDIQEVQDKLREICDDNEFSPIPDTWKKSLIDELVEAIENGSCCSSCDSAGELAFEPLDVGDLLTGCFDAVGTIVTPTCEEVKQHPGPNGSFYTVYHRFERFIRFRSECIISRNFPGLRVMEPFDLPPGSDTGYVWELVFVMCRSEATKRTVEDNCPGTLDMDLEEIVTVSGPVEADGTASFTTPDPIEVIYPHAFNIGFKLRTRQA